MNWFFKEVPVYDSEKSSLPHEVKEAVRVLGDYLKQNENYADLFYFAQKEGGVSVLPNHFYTPIPDVFNLPQKTFQKSSLVQIEKKYENQLRLAQEFFQFKTEYESYPIDYVPNRFYYNNNMFVGSDPKLLHCFVRYFKPNKVIEVGSGFSTLLINDALIRNGKGEVIAIEPYPRDFLKDGMEKLSQLVEMKVEDVDVSLFEQLNENDILFIDSSHVLKLGSDVAYLYLEIIPRLKPGVLVHIHDICLPYYYPKHWVLEFPRLWNESYFLQALLQGNTRLEIMFGSFMLWDYLQENKIEPTVIDKGLLGGGSFWMRKS